MKDERTRQLAYILLLVIVLLGLLVLAFATSSCALAPTEISLEKWTQAEMTTEGIQAQVGGLTLLFVFDGNQFFYRFVDKGTVCYVVIMQDAMSGPGTKEIKDMECVR